MSNKHYLDLAGLQYFWNKLVSVFYKKPSDGIPITDLNINTQLAINKGVESYDELFTESTVDAMSKKMCDSYISLNPNLDVQGESKWAYQAGFTLMAMLRVYNAYGGSNLLNYATNYYHGKVGSSGITNSTVAYNKTAYNLDHVQPGYNLFLLKTLDSSTTYQNYYENVISILADQIKDQPTVSAGTYHPYIHKASYNKQVWLDGSFMALPFKTLYAKERLGGTENQATVYDSAAGQLIDIADLTYDPVTHLYRHAYSEDSSVGWIDPDTNGQSYFCWGRALGWFMMAISEVLDILPSDHSKRSNLIKILTDLCEVLPNYADSVSGVYRNLPTYGTADSRNKLEATSSCMFSYVYLHGVNKGYLPASMLQYAKELYENVVNEFVTTSGNTVSLNNCVTGGNPGATSTTRAQVIENYLTKTYAADDPHGVPAFILASLEYETLFPTRTSKLSTVAFTGSYNDLTNKPSVPTVIFRQW